MKSTGASYAGAGDAPCFELLRRRRNSTPSMNASITAKPPTAHPAIAPAFDECWGAGDDIGVEDALGGARPPSAMVLVYEVY